MINLVTLIIGIVLVVGIIVSFIYSRLKTPDHLRGYYGRFYAIISSLGILGGIALIVLSFIR